MSSTKTSRIGSVIAFVVSGIFVLLAVWLFLNRQTVLDQISVWSYEPTSDVQTISERVAFTDRGEFIFYATKPELQDQEAFNQTCPRQEAGSPILGCYTTDDRIYVYNLTDAQLDGMEEVTAAHEMLHAAWYRMTDEERAEKTKELRAAYEKLEDEELKSRMEYYERTEPGELANELHSILGTEVANLGEPLESYYGAFFDRQKVLALHGQYSGVYKELHAQADELYAQMQSLSDTLEQQSASYDTAVAQLSADIESFNERARNGDFTTQAQFNRERAALTARSAALEVQRQQINANIETYNKYYAEYQEIAQQIEVLNDSIDSYKEIEETPSV